MHKHKHLLHKITLVSSAAILAASLIPLAYTTVTSNNVKVVKANNVTNDTTYVPLEITDESLNSNVFIIANETSGELGWYKDVAPLDKEAEIIGETENASSAWYTKSAHSATGDAAFDPDSSGNVTITSDQDSNLQWTIKNIGQAEVGQQKLKNNAIRIWNEDGHKSQTITFNNLGIYSGQLFLLVTAANATGGTSELNVKINYSDGSDETKSFTVYDWCNTPSTASTSIACQSHYRYTRVDGTKHHVYDKTKPKMVQCGIDVNPSKFIKNIEVIWGEQTTKGMVLTIYGVSGTVASVKAPTNLNAQIGSKTTKSTLTWTTAENADAYSLDIATDKNFTTGFFGDYQNKRIERPEGTTVTVNVSDLKPGETYYTRVRSIDASNHQSAPCDYVSFKVDEVSPTAIQVFDLQNNIAKTESHNFTTSVKGEYFDGKYYPCAHQDMDWAINPSEGLKIEKVSTAEGEATWKMTGEKAGTYTVNGDCYQQLAPQFVTTVTVTPPEPKNLSIEFIEGKDDQLIVKWDKVENIDNYVLSVATDENFQNKIIDNERLDADVTSRVVEKVSRDITYYARLVTIADGINSNPAYANIIQTSWWSWWIVAGGIMGVGLFASLSPIISVANNIRLEKSGLKDKDKNKK